MNAAHDPTGEVTLDDRSRSGKRAGRTADIRAHLTAATPGPRLVDCASGLDPRVDERIMENAARMFVASADAELVVSARADLAWLLEELEAAETRAAAAEARYERTRVQRAYLTASQREAAVRFKAPEATSPAPRTSYEACPAGNESIGRRFPQTPAHEAISDALAARLLAAVDGGDP